MWCQSAIAFQVGYGGLWSASPPGTRKAPLGAFACFDYVLPCLRQDQRQDALDRPV